MLDKKQDEEITKLDMLIRGMSGENSSNAILAQEAREQAALVNSEALPKECPRAELEALGFIFGDEIDDLFIRVTMPQGWRKQATNHSMHSDLIDDKGRRRGGIFYKAAFYDRSARMHLERRYLYNTEPVNGYDSPTYSEDNQHGFVRDKQTGETIFKTAWVLPKDYQAEDNARAEAKAWLMIMYPDWENPLAYWD